MRIDFSHLGQKTHNFIMPLTLAKKGQENFQNTFPQFELDKQHFLPVICFFLP